MEEDMVPMRRGIAFLFVTLIVCSVIALIYMVMTEDFDSLPPLDDGQYYRMLASEYHPRAEITSFIVTETHLYTYYDSAGLVNVYSLDGKFLYGIQLEIINNGSGDMAIQNDLLYIESRGSRMFVFSDGELVQTFLRKESPDMFVQIESFLAQDKNHTLGDATYYFVPEANQITKSTPQAGWVTVIALPKYNRNIESLSFFLLIVIAAFMHFLQHADIRRETKSLRNRNKTEDDTVS